MVFFIQRGKINFCLIIASLELFGQNLWGFGHGGTFPKSETSFFFSIGLFKGVRKTLKYLWRCPCGGLGVGFWKEWKKFWGQIILWKSFRFYQLCVRWGHFHLVWICKKLHPVELIIDWLWLKHVLRTNLHVIHFERGKSISAPKKRKHKKGNN